jgi:hypothetical protein
VLTSGPKRGYVPRRLNEKTAKSAIALSLHDEVIARLAI